MAWQAPESGSAVSFQATNASDRSEDVEFEHLDTVDSPPEGSRVIAKPFRTVSRVALRSSPDSSSANNIIGRFNPGQTVEIIGLTPDAKWVMVGEDNIIVGYAQREGFSETGQSLRRAQTERHYVDTSTASAARTAKRKGKGSNRAAKPTMTAQMAPPPNTAQVRTTRVAATTQCKSLVAATGQAQDKKTGCNRPDGKWVFA